MNTRYSLSCICIGLSTLVSSEAAIAVDATRSATEVLRSGRWLLIEFAAREQLVYRISSQSSNSDKNYLAFDFAPSDKCVPLPAVMSSAFKAYSPALDHGNVPMSYRSPGQSESTEVTETEMAPGDSFAFFQFKGLTTALLLKSHDKGSLSVWVPGSGDGTVKRSGNIYFSLEGFTAAYQGAWKRCHDNR